MNVNYLSPYIRVAMDNQAIPPWHMYERVIYDYLLLYIKSGELNLKIDGVSYHGIPGDIILFKPKQPHSFDIIGTEIYRQPHLHFDFFYQPDSPDVKVSFKALSDMSPSEMKMFREDITDNFFSPFPTQIRLYNTEIFEKMLFDVIHEFNSSTPFHEINTSALFLELWAYLLREIYWMNNVHVYSNIELLNTIKSYLELNLDKVITLQDLAEKFHLSKYYLSRLFRTTFGVTPIQFHLVARINKAKELIQFSTSSISSISEQLGFQSIHSFSRAFKKKEHVPPTFYRK